VCTVQADFSFFFDTGGRRRCYLAPERFYEASSAAAAQGPTALTPAMDVFSLGCVLAELFTDGAALFDLSQARFSAPIHTEHVAVDQLSIQFALRVMTVVY
jgi:serine/threonine protein kinase